MEDDLRRRAGFDHFADERVDDEARGGIDRVLLRAPASTEHEGGDAERLAVDRRHAPGRQRELVAAARLGQHGARAIAYARVASLRCDDLAKHLERAAIAEHA